MYVSKTIAEIYATEEWPMVRIQRVHDLHVHYIDGAYSQNLPCPNCHHCRCPVPIENHEEEEYSL